MSTQRTESAEPTRWVDWSVLQDYRERGIGVRDERVLHEREIKAAQRRLDCERSEAVRQLQFGDVEIDVDELSDEPRLAAMGRDQ